MEDRRIRRTRRAIHDAFIHLLKTHELEQITIQQIADEADINRATFYKHYEDKYILLETLEDNEMENIRKHFDYKKFLQHHQSASHEIIGDIPKSIINLILDNIELYEVLFRMQRRSTLEDKIAETILQNLRSILPYSETVNGIPFRYYHSYIAGALIATIKLWVLDEHRVSADSITHDVFKLFDQGPLKILLSEIAHIEQTKH